MNLSIVILTCNQKALTERCLQSIYDLTLSSQIEIIVIDNGSTDDTDSLISNKYPRVIYHRNDKNNGVASGRNLGVSLSRGTMIMFLDNDTIAEPSTILEMLDYINGHSDIGLLAPCLISPSGQIQQSFKQFPGIGIKLKNFLSNGQASQYVPLVPDTPIEPFYVIGAAQLFSRHLFNLIGGLDSRIFYGPEDADFCMAVRSYGLRVVYNPQFTIIHDWQRATSKQRFTRLAFRHAVSLIYFYFKHRRFC